ncbi:hypothetical protein BDW75DRAFT_243404 [Aspergillus navahoensis]
MARTPLTVSDYLGLGLGVAKSAASVVAAAAMPWSAKPRPASYLRHLTFTLIRSALKSIPVKTMVGLSNTTDEMYADFMKSAGLAPDTIKLEDGTRLHLLGSRTAKTLLLYSHGGGYAMYATKMHFEILLQLVTEAQRDGGSLAVAFISYDVSSVAVYPHQLKQACNALNYILGPLGWSPSDVLIGGDSAGGNLSLALLSHIVHPLEGVVSVDVSGSFKGVALVSPWVTFDTVTSKSMQRNRYKDTLAVEVLNEWSSVYRGQAPKNQLFYQEPLTATPQWWRDVPVQEFLVVAGADEIFVDDICEFASKLMSVHSSVSYIATDSELHDHMIAETLLKEPMSQMRATFQSWVVARSR